jgi:putative transposase
MCWLEIPRHFANVTLDAFIIMPDHLHGIVIITDTPDRISVGAQHAAPLQRIRRSRVPAGPEGLSPGSLGAILRGFKSAATKRINEMRHTPGEAVWQRNYYDRIIRNDEEMRRARDYVLLNPTRWKDARRR